MAGKISEPQSPKQSVDTPVVQNDNAPDPTDLNEMSPVQGNNVPEERTLVQRIQLIIANISVQQMTSGVVGMLAIVYIIAASRILIGIFLMMGGTLISIAYLRMRQKRFELSPLALLESAAQMATSQSIADIPRTNRRCTACGENDCGRHKVNTFVDVDSIKISSAIDKELATIVELTIQTYVYPWYKALSDDHECTDEMRMLIKHIMGKLVQRLRGADFPKWTINELAPLAFAHVEAYLAAKSHCEEIGKEDDVYNVALHLFSDKHHAALLSDEMYFRLLSTSLLDLLLPPESKDCRTLKTYFAEAITAYAFKTNVEFFSAPHYINRKVTSILQQTPMEIPPLGQASEQVYLLQSILPTVNPASAFTKSLDEILNDRTLLKPFQKYLENTGYIEALILYRNLEVVLQQAEHGVNDDNLDIVVSLTKDIHASLESGPEFMQVYIKPIFMEALEATKNSIEPSTCKIEPLKELFDISKADLENRLRILFLKSEGFFVSLCGMREGNMRKRAATTLIPEKKKKGKAKDGLTQAEISAMNLPAPPSVMEELHPHLVQEEKKKGLFFRRKDKKKLDFNKLQFAPVDADGNRLKNVSQPASANTSPDLSGMRKAISTTSLNDPSPRSRSSSLAKSIEDISSSAVSLSSSPKSTSFLGRKHNSSITSNTSRPRSSSSVSSFKEEEPGIASREQSDLTDDNDIDDDFEAIDSSILLSSFALTSLDQVVVEVSNWERRHPGVRQYIVYNIKVLANGRLTEEDKDNLKIIPQWNVYRRYSEFAELEKRLKALYPEYLAELPDKKRFGNLEKQLIDSRLKSLNAYIQSLLSNPLVHTDNRCTETICQFLNPECNFKQYQPSYSVNKKFNAVNVIKKRKENFASFIDLFLITEEESAEATRAVLSDHIAQWNLWNEEVEANRAPSSTPLWTSNMKKSEKLASVNCFSTEATPPAELIGFSNKAAHVIGRMIGRLQYRMLWRPILGLARYILGGTIEANVVALCAPMWNSDEAYVVYLLKYVQDIVFRAHDEEATPTKEDIDKSKARFIDSLKKQCPGMVQKIVGQRDVDEICNCIVEAFQNHRYNKQLAYFIVDAIVKELFPELAVPPKKDEDKDKDKDKPHS